MNSIPIVYNIANTHLPLYSNNRKYSYSCFVKITLPPLLISHDVHSEYISFIFIFRKNLSEIENSSKGTIKKIEGTSFENLYVLQAVHKISGICE